MIVSIDLFVRVETYHDCDAPFVYREVPCTDEGGAASRRREDERARSGSLQD